MLYSTLRSPDRTSQADRSFLLRSLLGFGTTCLLLSSVMAQCTGAIAGTAMAPNAGWAPAAVPPNMMGWVPTTTNIGINTASVNSVGGLSVGNLVSGPNVPGGTTITAIGVPGPLNITLSNPASVTGTNVLHQFTVPAYAFNYPPSTVVLPGNQPSTTAACSVCPATFSTPICGNQFVNFYACAGNLYTISTCTSTPATNFSLSITTTTNALVAGFYGQSFDNDGCGVPNGPATLQFSPQSTGPFRIRVLQNPCVANALLCGTLSIQCSIPTPPPNDEPCTAVSLGVPPACSYQLTSAVWGTATSGIPAPGCGAYFGSDVWYTAVVPASGNLQIRTTLVSAVGLGMAVYTAPACNAPQINWSLVACSPSAPPLLDVSGLGLNNQTVYIRVWPQNNISYMGTFNICAFEPTPPANDLPCGAFALATPTVCATSTYSTEFGTNTIPPGLTVGAPTCGGAINNDVWFSVVVPATGAFTVNTFAGTLTDMAMAWYRLSGGGSLCNPPGFSGTMTQIACNDNQFAPTNNMPRINSQTAAPAIAPPLVPGETIYIRIWPQGANLNGDFSICATENVPPVNDDPCGAIPLATSLSCNLVPTTNEGAGDTAIPPGPVCGLAIQNDVWYTVIVPPNGQLEINTQGVGMTNAALALYQITGGSCATSNLTLGLVPPVNCQTGGSSFGVNMPQQLFAGLSPGTTVYVRVWREGLVSPVGQFNICARQTAAAPINGCDLNSSDSGGPSGNYGNNEVYEQTYCPVNPGDVVAIDFMAFSTQANNDFLTVYNGPSIASPVLGVFSGGALPPGLVSSHASGCLTIRFTSNASVVSSGWQLSVSCGPPLPPPPPPCHTTTASGSVLQTVGSVIYDTGGPGGIYTNNEFSTYTYCPSTPGEKITMTFSSFSVEQNFDFLTVFNGPTVGSPSLGTFTGNVNPGTFTSTDPGGCLTIRWTSDFSIVGPGWAATLRCGLPQPPPPPPPPPSGVCGTTVYDPGGPGGTYGNTINQNPNNFGGNNCWPYTCSGGGVTNPPGQPLWFQTYCPSVAGDAVTLTFNTFDLEFGWDNVYIYNGPVVSPNNANGTQFLSGGGLPTCGGPAGWCNQTLGAGGFTGTANPGSFTSTHPSGCLTISMTSDDIVNYAGWTATISCQTGFDPNAACIFALRMYDSFGDGWAGSRIAVVINAGTPNYYTVTSGQFDQVLISANNGDNISITYSGVGYFSGDNSWTLDQVGAPYSVYHSAIPAVNGTYSFVANCSTQPLPPQSDCVGAQVLCNSNPVVAQTNHVGSVGDFTATSGGCLSIYERQGVWYAFTAGNTNPMGFTITPTGAADINWAVWGPFPNTSLPSAVCGPSGAPIRCSFASAANTFAATGSYNTGIGSPTYSPPPYAAPTPGLSQTTAGNGWLSGINPAQGDVYLLYVSNATANNTPATITWTGTGIVDCVILPVEFLSFEAFARDMHVDVKWSTASENGSGWFNVQRSGDGETFTNIGRVNASGVTYSRMDYQFKDNAPLPGLSYYRLEQVDLDGTATLTHAVPVYFKGTTPSLQVYPNPARDVLVIATEFPSDGYLDWRIVDGAGRTAMSGGAFITEGMQRLELPVGRLDAGVYQVILRQGTAEVGRARFARE